MDRFDKFKNLMVMAAADGSLTEEEIAFLSARSKRWGLSDHEFADAIQYALQPDAKLTVPPDQAERVELLRDLVRMMAADGQLADIEKQLFAVAAATMNVSDAQLNKILDSILS